MKVILAASLAGLIFGGGAMNAVAQATGFPETPWERYGVLGILAAIVMYGMTKMVPDQTKMFSDAVRAVVLENKEAAVKVAIENKEAAIKAAIENKEAAIKAAIEHKEAAVEVAKHHVAANLAVCNKLDNLIDSSRLITSEIKAGSDLSSAMTRQLIMNIKKVGEEKP